LSKPREAMFRGKGRRVKLSTNTGTHRARKHQVTRVLCNKGTGGWERATRDGYPLLREMKCGPGGKGKGTRVASMKKAKKKGQLTGAEIPSLIEDSQSQGKKQVLPGGRRGGMLELAMAGGIASSWKKGLRTRAIDGRIRGKNTISCLKKCRARTSRKGNKQWGSGRKHKASRNN